MNGVGIGLETIATIARPIRGARLQGLGVLCVAAVIGTTTKRAVSLTVPTPYLPIANKVT